MADSLIITTSSDPFRRGLDYLYGVRSLALEPEMVDEVYDQERRVPVCTWIGQNIEAVNAQLRHYLQACHGCFHEHEQRSIQIYAAPLAQSFKLSALCNLSTRPITLLIDVGQVVPEDWLRLVVHEYAHAHAGSPGHHEQFARSLAHLCLGLGLRPPVWSAEDESALRFYPDCRLTQNPSAFWRGEAPDWRSRVKNYYFISRSVG